MTKVPLENQYHRVMKCKEDRSIRLPPTYEDAVSPPPPYSDRVQQDRYMVVSRRLMVVLTLTIMVLLSLLVTLSVKHCQLYTLHANSVHHGQLSDVHSNITKNTVNDNDEIFLMVCLSRKQLPSAATTTSG